VPCTYVHTGRSALVEAARDADCEDLFFIDSDMVGWGAQHAARILSHDVDIVGGIYCKRKPGDPEWLFHTNPSAVPDEHGLLEVNDIATGFLRIRMKVFDELFSVMPERQYFDPKRQRVCCEYFPMGVVERSTANPATSDPMQNEPIGEDVYFCRLARKHGFKVYADTHVVIRHRGMFDFPSNEEMHKVMQ
jgi:hypothetical protein